MGNLHPVAAQAWNTLALVAKSETGQNMTATSLADTYRSYTQQETVFRQRYTTSYNPITTTTEYKIWNGQKWYKKRGVAQVATPGTSNHGLGLAIDAALWVQKPDGSWKIEGVTTNGLFFAWLSYPNLAPEAYRIGTGSNAESFGFSWEVQSEPWHLRFVEGAPTQRIKDIEAFFAGMRG